MAVACYRPCNSFIYNYVHCNGKNGTFTIHYLVIRKMRVYRNLVIVRSEILVYFLIWAILLFLLSLFWCIQESVFVCFTCNNLNLQHYRFEKSVCNVIPIYTPLEKRVTINTATVLRNSKHQVHYGLPFFVCFFFSIHFDFLMHIAAS